MGEGAGWGWTIEPILPRSTLLNLGGLNKDAICVLLDTIQNSHAMEFTLNRGDPLPCLGRSGFAQAGVRGEEVVFT